MPATAPLRWAGAATARFTAASASTRGWRGCCSRTAPRPVRIRPKPAPRCGRCSKGGRNDRNHVADLGFQLLDRAGPVVAQEAGEGTVGEDAAPGLATRAVVHLVLRESHALNGGAAVGAGLAESAVDGEIGAEGGHVPGAGELLGELLLQALRVTAQQGSGGFEEARRLLDGQV